MAIPDFQSIMLPLLQLLGDGAPGRHSDLRAAMAAHFKLSDEEQAELLTSGRQSVFYNRVAWAISYLRKAVLVVSPERSTFAITPRGRELLTTHPEKIDIRLLNQFPEFREFRATTVATDTSAATNAPVPGQEQTPEDLMGSAYKIFRRTLAEDILERLRKGSPRFFENVVVEVLSKVFGVDSADAVVTGKSGDGGIDGIIRQDKLGLDLVHLQAKKWDRPVGRPDVQAFAGSLEGAKSKRGVFITTSTFSAEAKSYVQQIDKKIVLLDGGQLADHMIDNDIGVSPGDEYRLKRVDQDYFDEE